MIIFVPTPEKCDMSDTGLARTRPVLWYNLKILAQVRPHERVESLHGDLIVVSQPGPFEGLRRRWSGETRGHNLTMVQSILDTAFREIEDLRRTGSPESPEARILARLARELTAARAGCRGLQATYESDRVACAKLACMVESLDHYVEVCRRPE